METYFLGEFISPNICVEENLFYRPLREKRHANGMMDLESSEVYSAVWPFFVILYRRFCGRLRFSSILLNISGQRSSRCQLSRFAF